MNHQTIEKAVGAVKLGQSRQVVIPKKIHDALGLIPGDYLEVELRANKVIFTPKMLVDKRIEAGVAESFGDFRRGRVYGPFTSAKAAVRALHARKGRGRKSLAP